MTLTVSHGLWRHFGSTWQKYRAQDRLLTKSNDALYQKAQLGCKNDWCQTCSVPTDMEVMVCSSRMFTKDLLVIVSCSCLSNNEPLVIVSSSVLSYSDKPVMVCSSCLSPKAFCFSFFWKQNHFDHYSLCANTLGTYSWLNVDVRILTDLKICFSIDMNIFIVFVQCKSWWIFTVYKEIKDLRYKFLINYQINLKLSDIFSFCFFRKTSVKVRWNDWTR